MYNSRGKLLTTKEAAQYLGISASTIYRMEKLGLLVAYRTPGGQRRFSQKSLEEYLQESQSFKSSNNPANHKKSFKRKRGSLN